MPNSISNSWVNIMCRSNCRCSNTHKFHQTSQTGHLHQIPTEKAMPKYISRDQQNYAFSWKNATLLPSLLLSHPTTSFRNIWYSSGIRGSLIIRRSLIKPFSFIFNIFAYCWRDNGCSIRQKHNASSKVFLHTKNFASWMKNTKQLYHTFARIL